MRLRLILIVHNGRWFSHIPFDTCSTSFTITRCAYFQLIFVYVQVQATLSWIGQDPALQHLRILVSYFRLDSAVVLGHRLESGAYLSESLGKFGPHSLTIGLGFLGLTS